MSQRSVLFLILGLISPLLTILVWYKRSTPTAIEEPIAAVESLPEIEQPEITPPAPPPEILEAYTIQKGDYLGKILPKYDLPVVQVLEASKPIFNLSKIRVGKTFQFIKKDGQYIGLYYPIDKDSKSDQIYNQY